MNIEALRADTPGCINKVHFNNAGASLMPKPVVTAIHRYIDKEEANGGYETADLEAASINAFYKSAARLLHCEPRNIAYTTSATDSYNRALSSVPFKSGDVVLVSANDYPSNFISFISLQKRFGIRIVVVQNNSAGEIDLNDLQKKLTQYSPKLVSVSHVPTSSGLVQPAVEIGNIVKRYETLYFLDACQSLGQLPVDGIETNADFLSGTMRKFLRGPRGAGLLYVSDKALQSGFQTLFPDLSGAEWTGEQSYTPRNDARRFEEWETAYALMAGSREAIDYALNVGLHNIEARNKELCKSLREKLAETKHVTVQDRGDQLCSIITFTIPDKEEMATRQYFRDRGINLYTTSKSSAILDFEKKKIDWVVRVSPHYYNTEVEIERFMAILCDLV